METIFDHDVTEEELIKIFTHVITKEEHTVILSPDAAYAYIYGLYLIRGNEAKANEYLNKIQSFMVRQSAAGFDEIDPV